MGRYDEQPAFWVMDWLVDGLRSEGIIPDATDYETDLSDTDGNNFVVPFFTPAQQSPEVTTVHDEEGFSNVPFAIYNITHTFDDEKPYMSNGELSFIMYSDDTDLLMKIVAFIIDIAGRSTWSAESINSSYTSDDTYPYDFKTVYVDSASGPMETDDEGGRFSYMITICYKSIYEGPSRPPETLSAYALRNVGRLYS